MARHKRIRTEEQDEPKMDISSMIDCCFLLLIYFLVATTLVSEKKLDMAIPSPQPHVNNPPPPIDPLSISIEASGVITMEEKGGAGLRLSDEYSPTGPRRLETLVQQVEQLKNTAKQVGATPIVIVKANAEVQHQRVVDVMGALAEAGVNSVGLQTVEGN